ncbi:lycopene cyclase domain-containing protein [Glutamicibacter arilaitensis]|uniref:lycopene cyclase domain-containing protein n=1 Tax=Glutamicibacter arilaitensis TaxID=256701 RepID=UPI003F9DC10E
MFLEMSLIFLIVAAAVFAAGMAVGKQSLRSVAKPLGAAMALMLALTAVFDNLMIAAGLFGYGSGTLTGWRIGLAPIEDFFYAACAVLLVPGLWWLLGFGPTGSSTSASEGSTSRKDGS